MAGPRRDLFKLLANDANRSILAILAVEPQYPRRLAELVGLTETETSRRLRAMAAAGLLTSQWAHEGRTVRLYKLSASRLEFAITGQGVKAQGTHAPQAMALEAPVEAAPTGAPFVGRREESQEILRLLQRQQVVWLHGLAGIGKSSLAAAVARRRRGPIIWITCTAGLSPRLLLNRIASGLRQGEPDAARARRLLAPASTFASGSDLDPVVLDAVLEAADRRGATLVIDRAETMDEEDLRWLPLASRRLLKARIAITSRQRPRAIDTDTTAVYHVRGLAPRDAASLLRRSGARLPASNRQQLYERFKGHPLALSLAAKTLPAATDRMPRTPSADDALRDFILHDVIENLPDAERQDLLRLCVFDGPFGQDEAAAVLRRRDPLHALLALERRSLLTRLGSSHILHDLLRPLAMELAPDAKALHAQAARALMASAHPARVLEGLRHALAAGQADKAAKVVTQEVTERRYRFFDRGLGRAYASILEALHAAAPSGVDGVGVRLELANLRVRQGRGEEAAHLLEPLRASKVPTSLAPHAIFIEGYLSMMGGHHSQAVTRFDRAWDAAAAAKQPSRQLEAALMRAIAMEDHRPEAEVSQAYEQAAALAAQHGDVAVRAEAALGLSRLGARRKDPRTAEWMASAEEAARSAGMLRGLGLLEMTLCENALFKNDLDEARVHAERYMTLAEDLGESWMRMCAHADFAFLELLSGNYAKARAIARKGVKTAPQLHGGLLHMTCRVAEAAALLGLDRPTDAVALLRQGLDDDAVESAGIKNAAWSLLARAEREAGRTNAARKAALNAQRLRTAAADAPIPVWVERALELERPGRRHAGRNLKP